MAPRLLAAAAIGLACIGPLETRAAKAAADTEVNSIQQAVQRGADIFAHDQFGGVRTCETCHFNGGRAAGRLPDGEAVPSLVGAAAAFPRFAPRLQSVITLSQQLDLCIAGGLQGKPPAPGSPELVDLETYVTSLSKGVVMGQQFK
jgi:thiosulfate dehydrogenase